MRESFNGNTFRKIPGWKAARQELKVFDEECPGLALRFYPSGKGAWCILTRDWKATIGAASDFTYEDLPKLRELVTKARAMKAEGRDPSPLLKAFGKGRDVERAVLEADASSGVSERWEQARDIYLQHLRETYPADTYRTYRSAIGAVAGSPLEDDFRFFAGKPLALIEPDDVIAVRDSIHKRGRHKGPNAHMRQANASLAVIRAFFGWQMGRRGNPVRFSPAAAVPNLKPSRNKALKNISPVDESRALLQEELGHIIIGLESCPNAAARAAIMLQLLTGQRRMTVCEARKASFHEDKEYGYLWRFSDKSHSWRVLPLPKLAADTVEIALLMAREGNSYLFPQQRPSPDGSMNGHLNERTVSAVIEEMRAPGGALDDVKVRFATHDLRRAFATTMGATMHRYRVGDQRLTRTDVKMVTHINEGREGTASMLYDLNPYVPIKAAILLKWQDFVMEGYERAKEANRRKLGIAA